MKDKSSTQKPSSDSAFTQGTFNQFEQQIGAPVYSWTAPPIPDLTEIKGQFCELKKLNAEVHGKDLYQANLEDSDANWTYMPYGPFESEIDYMNWLESVENSEDTIFFAILDARTQKAVGLAAYLRISPSQGSIEVGHLKFSPLMQRTPISTEAMYLMMRYAFSLGYRRYEWKCNDFNEPSKKAALRLGFTFEGVFRQACIVKGHNRDTAWFSIIDNEWPRLEAAFEQWLTPLNFDQGTQIERLSYIRDSIAST